MMSERRDPIDELRRNNPARRDKVASGLTDAELEAAMRNAMAARIEEDLVSQSFPWRRAVPAAAVVAVGAAIVLLVLDDGPAGTGSEQAFAGSAVDAAEANPRILVGAPGWTVTDVNEQSLEQGSGGMKFERQDQEISLSWVRVPDEYKVPDDQYLVRLPELGQWYTRHDCASHEGRGPCDYFIRETEIEVLGEKALLLETRTVAGGEATSDFRIDLPVVDGTLVSLYAYSMPRDELRAVLDSLIQVDVDKWLSALPDRVVQPLERPEIVDEMLADVPIPDSVDAGALKEDAVAADRYGVGVQVTQAVACGWMDQWAAAFESDDEATIDEATEAMATSPDWDILVEMDEGGGWSRAIWKHARRMQGPEPRELLDTTGTESLTSGPTFALGPSYAMGLGCDSLERTPVEQPRYVKNYREGLIPVEHPPA